LGATIKEWAARFPKSRGDPFLAPPYDQIAPRGLCPGYMGTLLGIGLDKRGYAQTLGEFPQCANLGAILLGPKFGTLKKSALPERNSPVKWAFWSRPSNTTPSTRHLSAGAILMGPLRFRRKVERGLYRR